MGGVHPLALYVADGGAGDSPLKNRRCGKPWHTYSEVAIRALVVNKTSGKLILYATYFVDYPPAKIARGDTEIVYTLYIAKKRAETRGFKVDREEKRGPPLGYSFAALGPPYTEPPKGAWCEYYPSDIPTAVCWYRKAWIGVDNLTAVFPSSYFAVYDGKTYMKVPVITLFSLRILGFAS